MGSRPPSVSDKDLIEAIEQECELNQQPVVSTKEVADVDFIDIQRQQVHSRLKELAEEGEIEKLEIGRSWKVWWVPEDKETEINSSKIWQNIDGSDIPEEKIEEHPDYSTPAYWEKLQAQAQRVANIVFYSLAFGFAIYLLRDADIPFLGTQTEQQIEMIGALALVGGLTLGIYTVAIWVAAQIGQELVDRGYDKVYEYYVTEARTRVSRKIPISVSLDWR